MEGAAAGEEQSRGKGVEEEEDERSTDNDPGSDNEEDQGKDQILRKDLRLMIRREEEMKQQ